MSNTQAVARSQDAQIFTARSAWDLITEATACLLRIAKQHRRDRWWFLGGESIREPERPPPGMAWLGPPPEPIDLRRDVKGHRVIFRGTVPGLSCVGRVVWNLGPQKRPLFLVDFTSRRLTLITLTIEVGFGKQTRAATIFTKRAMRGLSLIERQKLWRIFRRPYPRGTAEVGGKSPRITIEAGWGEPAPGTGIIQSQANPCQRSTWERLWIVPQTTTSEAVTQFLILLYLWRHDLIDVSPSATSKEWGFVKTFLGRRWRVRDDGEVCEVLERLRMKYGFPDRWQGVLAYTARVIRDLRSKKPRREVQMDPTVAQERMERKRRGRPLKSGKPWTPQADGPTLLSANEVASASEVSKRTVYRWASEGKLAITRSRKGRLRFDLAVVEARREEQRKLAGPRSEWRYLLQKLDARGKTREAAKKFLQRRRQAGKTPVEIAHEVMEGKRP